VLRSRGAGGGVRGRAHVPVVCGWLAGWLAGSRVKLTYPHGQDAPIY